MVSPRVPTNHRKMKISSTTTLYHLSLFIITIFSSHYYYIQKVSQKSNTSEPTMADPETLLTHQTLLLKEITVDYTPELCNHPIETNEITVLFDERGGSRWRTKTRYQYGTFGASIKCPDGNTNGLNFNLYLSSLEGQTNHMIAGTSNDSEQIHELGFDCSDGFHDCEFRWEKDFIEWSIDGEIVRRDDREEGIEFPEKAMFLYASVWDASAIAEGGWTGIYEGGDAPYACIYKDVRVPVLTAVDVADQELHPEHLIHQTLLLKEIAVDYTPEVCTHTLETNEITVLYDERGGSRWRTKTRYQYGTFGANIKCPDGNTNGLNFNLYLSSLEGDKSQDEIDFEFLGNNKGVVQTNHYTDGTGNKEQIHELGFDCSDGFHDYEIKWSKDFIEWSIDGKIIRRDDNEDGVEFPGKAMFLYASIWDASGINEGGWTGIYEGSDAPYACMYKDVRVPLLTALPEDDSEDLVC
ncbi:hypothetical protein MKX01_003296 [Papaver californicum]|nr:hypothetical protein MKX01_003296 [Papaver californicum]